MSTQRQTEIAELQLDDNRQSIVNKDYFRAATAEFATEQTDTEIVPAPGVGKRIIVKYLSIRTDGNNGEAWFTTTSESASQIIGKIYVSKFQGVGAQSLSIPYDENTSITFTSTTGTSKVFVVILYVVEDV